MAAGEYSRIRRGFWTDPDVKRHLSATEKLLALYFFSSPHTNLIGLYSCPLEYAAAEAGVPIEEIAEALAGRLARFMTYDQLTEELLVHRAAYHQVGETLKAGDNRVKGIRSILAATHSPYLVARFLELYPDWVAVLGVVKPCPEPPPPLSSPMVNRRGLEGASEGLRSQSIAVHSSTGDTGAKAPERGSIEKLSRKEFNAAAAERIRKWPVVPSDLAPELSIAKQWVADGLTPEEVLALIEAAPALQDVGEPSLRIWHSKKNRDGLNAALGMVRKRIENQRARERRERGGNAGEVLRRIS